MPLVVVGLPFLTARRLIVGSSIGVGKNPIARPRGMEWHGYVRVPEPWTVIFLGEYVYRTRPKFWNAKKFCDFDAIELNDRKRCDKSDEL
ncbi:hypothetical protein [Burkholderia sp. NLJ2]|uniref:hypothetical protein n=1 Tax=Burkholderia sp. NLJ2 TaxID=3090699 RepID=UPI003C6C002A